MKNHHIRLVMLRKFGKLKLNGGSMSRGCNSVKIGMKLTARCLGAVLGLDSAPSAREIV